MKREAIAFMLGAVCLAFWPGCTDLRSPEQEDMAVDMSGAVHVFRHGEHVRTVAFRPDGSSILTGGRDNMAVLWDAKTGAKRWSVDHGAFVEHGIFSRDGARVLICGANNTARLLDTATGDLLHSFVHTTPPGDPDAKDPMDREKVPDRIKCVALSPDGKMAATGGMDSKAILWSTGKGEKIRELVHGGYVNTVSFSPDGKRLLTASQDNLAVVWDVETGTKVHELAHVGLVDSAIFSPDGKLILTLPFDPLDNFAVLWDAGTGEKLHQLPHNDWAWAIRFSPDSQQILTASWDGSARLWDAASGKELRRFMHKERRSLAGEALKEAHAADQKEKESDTPREEDPPKQWVAAIAFSPDGKTIATGGLDRSALVWDVETGQIQKDVAHGRLVWTLAFSPDGSRLLTGSRDSTAALWNVGP